MKPDCDAPPEYTCPSCDDRAFYPVRCDRCDRAMTAGGVADDDADTTPAERRWLVAGPVIGVGAIGSFVSALMTDAFGAIRWDAPMLRELCEAVRCTFLVSTSLMGPGLFVLVGLLGAWLGRKAAAAQVREVRRARRRRRDLDAMGAEARTSLRDLRPGRVRVVGTIVDAAPVYSNHGLPCAACENLVDGGPSPAPRHPTGGRFTLGDEWGRRVDVDARHVRIVDGYAFDEEAHVPVGARVELVGTARFSSRDGAGHGASYRSPDCACEIVGSATSPVFVRALDAA